MKKKLLVNTQSNVYRNSQNSVKLIKIKLPFLIYVLDKDLWRYTEIEQNVLNKSQCPFIAKLYSTFENAENIFLVMNYYKGGTLRSLLARIKRMSESQAKFYICELALAI